MVENSLEVKVANVKFLFTLEAKSCAQLPNSVIELTIFSVKAEYCWWSQWSRLGSCAWDLSLMTKVFVQALKYKAQWLSSKVIEKARSRSAPFKESSLSHWIHSVHCCKASSSLVPNWQTVLEHCFEDGLVSLESCCNYWKTLWVLTGGRFLLDLASA